MAAIILPRKHYTQPQGRSVVDFAHPLLRDIYSITDPITARDLITEQFCAPTGAVLHLNNGQIFRRYNGAGNQLLTQRTAHATHRTYAIKIRRDAPGGGGLGRIFEKRTAAVTSQVELLYDRGIDATYSLGYSRASSGNATYEASIPAAAITTGIVQLIVVTHDTSSISNKPKIYVEGVSQPVTNVAGGAAGSWLTNSAAYVIGNRNNDSARGWDGLLGELFMWDRILSADEIRDFYLNPWQIFRAEPVRIYSLPPVLTIPSLSNPGVIDITATSARPQVTLAY